MTKEEVKEAIKEMFEDNSIEINVHYIPSQQEVHLNVSIEGESVYSTTG